MAMLLLFISWSLLVSVSASPVSFSPADNFLLNCGGSGDVEVDGRRFAGEDRSKGILQIENGDSNVVVSGKSGNGLPEIYRAARVFRKEATYRFGLREPGWFWIRLHFFSGKFGEFDLSKSVFNVQTDTVMLIYTSNFTAAGRAVVEEYLIRVAGDEKKLNLRFEPQLGSVAFINAIEVVSAPANLIADAAANLFPVGGVIGLTRHGYKSEHRINVGGPTITPRNDTLGRTWLPDAAYLRVPAAAKRVSVGTNMITFRRQGATALTAPLRVYASAVTLADSGTMNQVFNVTWSFVVDPTHDHLVRLHFADIVSERLNELYFNVFVNQKMAISALDLSQILNSLATAYYQDIVVNASLVIDGNVTVEIGPLTGSNIPKGAILNGIEIFKMTNSVDSLDGEFGVGGPPITRRQEVVVVGFAMMFGAFVGLGAMVVKWHKRPQDWSERSSFSTWLLPIYAVGGGSDTVMTRKNSSSLGSRKSALYSSGALGLGRSFTFAELDEATKSFDQGQIVGVGGFGNVYLGSIDGGAIRVAVKRGNPQSEQGINEFLNEIQMLSKLRHRHLVSLIGYCDENGEMILVYEYMSNGPFRDHLYGAKKSPGSMMTWKQRLKICIGAARGLHYLHTGTSQGIIHRDVKTTNILLDENLIAKVADFGLSKDAAGGGGGGHISTAVKGSFGYLDPEYFRKQQLTEKSDVYSFGVVLLEALCARPALDPKLPREQVNLADWAMQWKKKGLIEKIVDPELAGSANPESVKKLADLAEKCLAEYGVDRPSMGDVLWSLEYALQLHEASPEGKGREDVEESRASAVVDVTASTCPSPEAADRRSPSPAPGVSVSEQSGTDLLAQFTNLNGR